jgi:hypothetical protein
MKKPVLPLEPLVEFMAARGGHIACLDRAKVYGIERRRLVDNLKHARGRKQGLTVDKVDQWCIDVLGVMPQDIYGDAWWAA